MQVIYRASFLDNIRLQQVEVARWGDDAGIASPIFLRQSSSRGMPLCLRRVGKKMQMWRRRNVIDRYIICSSRISAALVLREMVFTAVEHREAIIDSEMRMFRRSSTAPS